MIRLRGVTWAHSRGYVPLVAAAEAWHDLNPSVVIHWDKRSFWGFGEGPLDEVARDYDLIVFDHPHTGTAASGGLLAPLDGIAVGECAGLSRETYLYQGRLYGLPIDGSCQAAAYRPDLMEQTGERLPRTWPEMLELAHRTGQIRCSFTPMGALGMLRSIATAIAEPAPGRQALEMLKELFDVCGPESLTQSPVRILGEMGASNSIIYAPLLYAYSNYSRAGFAPHHIQFTAPVTGSILGGAGLGISAFTEHRDAAFDFARWLISPECQNGLYLYAQGQPALRSVWTSEDANHLTAGFFGHLLPVMEAAYVRPNGPGYGEWQSRAGACVQAYLKGESSAAAAAECFKDSCLVLQSLL